MSSLLVRTNLEYVVDGSECCYNAYFLPRLINTHQLRINFVHMLPDEYDRMLHYVIHTQEQSPDSIVITQSVDRLVLVRTIRVTVAFIMVLNLQP